MSLWLLVWTVDRGMEEVEVGVEVRCRLLASGLLA